MLSGAAAQARARDLAQARRERARAVLAECGEDQFRAGNGKRHAGRAGWREQGMIPGMIRYKAKRVRVRLSEVDENLFDGCGSCILGWGDVKEVRKALAAGADANAAKDGGRTALMEASSHPSIMQILLAAGANPNAAYTRPLVTRR